MFEMDSSARQQPMRQQRRKRPRSGGATLLSSPSDDVIVGAEKQSSQRSSGRKASSQVTAARVASAAPILTALLSLSSSIGAASAQSTCRDNLSYSARPTGLNCVQHTFSQCGPSLKAMGYTDADLAELWINCPKSCGLLQRRCDNAGDDMYVDGVKVRPQKQQQQQLPMSNHIDKSKLGGNASTQNSVGGVGSGGSAGGITIDSNTPQHADSIYFYGTIHSETCFDGWSPLCQDNPNFVSEQGIPGCNFHTSLLLPGEDCTAWLSAGYTQDQVLELQKNCPCSCGVECGEVTQFPTHSPTMDPTSAPSLMPSASPTLAPSAEPSVSPSASPTASPSASPTASPSVSPSEAPTPMHTSAPSAAPTEATPQPTSEPSAAPSSLPTAKPSSSPSAHPTARPSAIPTVTASTMPSAAPSFRPSQSPSSMPSYSPTKSPTPKPSDGPTRDPTARPSFQPSVAPTLSPTNSPTRKPSDGPTRDPTMHPTARPSASPTLTPTRSPTRKPTDGPTRTPTLSPTQYPTPKPSDGPTRSPTASPSSSPSSLPSLLPSNHPTAAPSASPTLSHPPSASPTANPYCFDDRCIDDKDWRSANGMPCEMHGGLNNCLEWASVGYSDEDIYQLINACPCTCNIECNTWTRSPTPGPTQTPTLSPTKTPTQSPTESPTKLPSASPSNTPSQNPTISLAPSVSPSARPSLRPSVSSAPTVSAAPTQRVARPRANGVNGEFAQPREVMTLSGSNMTIIFIVGLTLGGLVIWAYGKYGPPSQRRGSGHSSDGSRRSRGSASLSSGSSRSSRSSNDRKSNKLKTIKKKRGHGKTTKGIKHQNMTQKLAKKKAGEQRFSNAKVGIRSAPSHVRAVRSDPKSRPRVSTMERPGESSRNKKNGHRQTFYTSATSTRVDEAKLRLKAAQDLKLIGGSVTGEVSDASPDVERGCDVSSEHTSSNKNSGKDRMRKLRSAFASSPTRSFGSNFSDFDPISAIRSKMSNVGGRLRGIDVEDDDDDVDSDDNSLRERYSLPEPVFSPTQLRTPKPQPLPFAAKIQPSSSSRQRARQCAVFDAMSGEESRYSRDDESTSRQGGRKFFTDAQIPILSEDASSHFDTVYTAQSAMEDGRLPATGGPPSPMNRRQVSFDASVMFSPSKEEKQTGGGRCRCG